MRPPSDMFHLMQVFCEVVRQGSFSGAAAVLGIQAPAVSKAIAKLESALDVSLLARSTRSMSLTEPGTDFHKEATQLLEHMALLQDRMTVHRDRPSGTLKVTATAAVGQYLLGPLLPKFLARFPDITLDLQTTDGVVDIKAAGVDVALRSTPELSDTTLFSRLVSRQPRVVVAAPGFVQKYSLPKDAEHLARYPALVYRSERSLDRWTFAKGGSVADVSLTPRLTSNSYGTILQAVRSGQGFAIVQRYLVDEELQSGSLVELMPEHKLPEQKIFALYHQKRSLSSKLDAFLTFLEEAVDIKG